MSCVPIPEREKMLVAAVLEVTSPEEHEGEQAEGSSALRPPFA